MWSGSHAKTLRSKGQEASYSSGKVYLRQSSRLVHSALNIRGGAQTGRGGSQTDQCGGHRSAHIDGGQSEPVLCMLLLL